jgi:hypothetical protein
MATPPASRIETKVAMGETRKAKTLLDLPNPISERLIKRGKSRNLFRLYQGVITAKNLGTS